MWQAVWLLACVVVQGLGEDQPSVVIKQGQLRGTFIDTRGGRRISAFEGIPYAAPPLGPLRFQKPVPAAGWEGVRDATTAASPCYQSNFTSLGIVFGSEDCLYINVYTHKVSNESNTPVLVFIHGGGFQEGSGAIYRPDFLMDKDIVLVTFNYRLGALGFLSLEDKDLPGNNGLKDQVLALKWVQENIGQFGGDPGAVTISGESAGGASVHYHMLSPLSKGLFQRAISQSGSAYCPWATHAPGQLRAVSERLAAHVGCNHFSTQDMLTCLRDIPPYVLVEVNHELHEWHIDPIIKFTPAIEPVGVDGAFLTADPWKLSSDIPWITGLNSAEGTFKAKHMSEALVVELNNEFEMIGPLTLMFRNTAEDPVRTSFMVKKFYFFDGDILPGNMENLTNMYSDAWFVHPVLESVRRHRGPKYLYYFDYRGANSIVPDYEGVSHFDDMAYFFPMHNWFRDKYNETVEDRRLSEKLVDMWANFVIHGKPTLDTSDVEWTPASETEHLHITKEGFAMKPSILKERDDFWSALPFREKYAKPEKDEL